MTDDTYRNICLFLRRLIEGTLWEGHLFAVGGCCRDTVMGLPVKDVDLAVSLPDGGVGFARWLHERGLTVDKPVLFEKYGTARLRLREFPDDEIELVQTRREKYTDRTSRDPSTAFGTIEEDCYRRDLTINTLYYDITAERMLDITGKGIADIESHVIRTPSDPDVTFDDDPVRILRAIRFAARYGWKIEDAVFESIKRFTPRLEIITPERMQGEFEKLLVGPRPAMALDMLREAGAMPYIIPELCATFDMQQSEYHSGTVWEHTLAVVDKVPDTPLLRMAALLHDIGKTTCRTVLADGRVRFPGHDRRCRGTVGRILNRLRYRSSFIDRVIFLCLHHEAAKSWGARAEKMSDEALRRLQLVCGSDRRFDNLLCLIDADNCSYAPEHCMPEQAAVVRRRSAELVRDRMALFGYSLPLKPSRIRRIKAGDSDKALEECVAFLTSLACADPRIGREEMARRLEKFSPKAPCKESRKRGGRRRRGAGKERRGKNQSS